MRRENETNTAIIPYKNAIVNYSAFDIYLRAETPEIPRQNLMQYVLAKSSNRTRSL